MTIVAALEREHRDIDGCVEAFLDDPAGAADVLRTGLAALRRHIYLEEVFLFPPVRAAGLEMPVQVMLTEHGQIWRLMDQAIGALDSGDPEAAVPVVEEMLGLLDRHNAKEEPVIYPHADTDLQPDQADQLDLFIGMGSMPHDWVCERALP
ncbi:MAG: hemerythrin domain-containing protein [Propionibacteriaceae bacterium]|nr:hemerythrin domain-containing protein [Propionibacteriaceae bacterium]